MDIFFYMLLAFDNKQLDAEQIKNQSRIKMDIDKITNPVAQRAIEALQIGDRDAWSALFTSQASFYDDGNKRDLGAFTKSAIGHERFTSIDKVEDDGTSVFGNFHSDQWGDFKTYFKFTIGSDGKINKLEIGQADY